MIKLIDVSKAYSNKNVLNKINLEIPKSNMVAILGPNGSGKTTLLNIIGGLIKFEGDIVIDKYSQRKEFVKYMENVSYIPNTPFIYDYLTFEEHIQIFLTETGNKDYNLNIYKELVERFNLHSFKNILCKNLSLGTRQKLAFIIAYFNKPKAILMDEPFVNFDNESVTQAVIFSKNYVKDYKSVILYSTHTHSNSKILTELTDIELQINELGDLIALQK